MADDGRTYIRLHDGMPDHPKVEGLSDKAFRLLVETWCWSSRHLTDGRVPRGTWTRRGTPATRRELVTAGLAQDLGTDGVQMHDYLQHQRSRAEVAEVTAARRAAALKANHHRWHTGSKGRPDASCLLCAESESETKSDAPSDPGTDAQRIGDRNPTDIHIDIGTDRVIGTVLPEETLGGGVPDPAAQARPPAPSLDPNNPRCARHAAVPAGDPGPDCRHCRDVRLQVEQAGTAVVDAAQAERAARRAAIDACGRCNENGLVELDEGGQRRCDHQAAAVAR